jgi:hypothetical protein
MDNLAEQARIKKIVDDHLVETGVYEKLGRIAGCVESADAAFFLIEQDPHQWSTRPCQTCLIASQLIGRKFGCSAKREGK